MNIIWWIVKFTQKIAAIMTDYPTEEEEFEMMYQQELDMLQEMRNGIYKEHIIKCIHIKQLFW